MRGPLIERLPPGSPKMADFDESIAEADHRRSITYDYEPSSDKRYARCFRRYVEWCSSPEVRYQSEPQFISTDKITEFTIHMTTVRRYALPTVSISVRALEIYAERAGVEVSVGPARAVLERYRLELESQGEAKPPKRRLKHRR